MKILNSIHQLQNQLVFCPLCQKANRNISIENNFQEATTVHCRSYGNQIKMRVHTDTSKSFRRVITYDLNIHNNDFDFMWFEKQNVDPPVLDVLIVGKCPENHTRAAGTLVLNTSNKKIENIQYNKESIIPY